MGKFSKIALGLNVVAVLCVLVALIVDTLSTVDDSISSVSYTGTYGATEGEIKASYVSIIFVNFELVAITKNS